MLGVNSLNYFVTLQYVYGIPEASEDTCKYHHFAYIEDACLIGCLTFSS